MKKVILVASIGLELSTTMANAAFEPEPIIFHNHRKEWIEPKLYNDVPRNKFIDKPIHNFKKR